MNNVANIYMLLSNFVDIKVAIWLVICKAAAHLQKYIWLKIL